MCDFNLIEYGYNAADETINFGTRNFADGDNLYEARTLATLKCSEGTGCSERNSNPHLRGLLQNSCIYFSVDSCIKIFKNKQCSEIIFDAHFTAIVDSYCLSSDGGYLLICLRDGSIRILDCNKAFSDLFNESCGENIEGQAFFINSFLDKDTFLIVTRYGKAYRCSFQNSFALELLYEFNFVVNIAAFEERFLVVHGNRTVALDIESNFSVSCDDYGFKKIFSFTDFLLALDVEGNLYKISTITMVVCPLNNPIMYKDIQVVSDDVQTQIIALTEIDSSTELQLLSYPEFSKIYSLKVEDNIYLLNLELTSDELLYISKISSETGVEELRFRSVYETDPEQRLQRLLKRRKYEEAEKFASLFCLDPTAIKMSKAQTIVEKSNCTKSDIDSLLSLLHEISDDEFRLQCCAIVESYCSRFEDTERILRYGCELVVKRPRNRDIEELQGEVVNKLYRFETWMALGQDQCPWSVFSCGSLIETVKGYLRNNQIEEAKIIYSRLDEESRRTLTEGDVADILNTLNHMARFTHQSFMAIFVPITLALLPSTLSLMVTWTYNTVSRWEKKQIRDFLHNAIELTQSMVRLLSINDVNEVCFLQRDSSEELSLLLSALRSLKTLKTNFNISIPVASYLDGPQNVVRILLGVQLRPEEYKVLIEEFLLQFLVEHALEPNQIFLDEIEDLMKYEEKYWVDVVPVIINSITSSKMKLTAIVKVLEFSEVPWTASVKQIANDCLTYSHPLVTEVRKLIENEPIRVVLSRPEYNIKDNRITDDDDVEFFTKRIIYCNQPTMIEDVYTLAKSSKQRHLVNMSLIQHFVRVGRLEQAIEILDNNPPEEKQNCAREFTYFFECTLNKKAHTPPSLLKNLHEISKTVFDRLAKEDLRVAAAVTSAYDLFAVFQIDANTSDLMRPSSRKQILIQAVDEVCHRLESGKISVEEVFKSCDKIARCLSADPHDVLIRLCNSCGDYDLIFKAATRLYADDSASHKNLCLMAVLLLKFVGVYKVQVGDESFSSEDSVVLSEMTATVDDALFSKGLHLAGSLAAQAVVRADGEDLLACLEVAKWTNTACYATISQNEELRRLLFGDMYNGVCPGFHTFTAIRTVFMTLANCKQESTYVNYFEDSSSNFEEELKSLPFLLENLFKEGQHFTAYKIVLTLLESLTLLENVDAKLVRFVEGLLKKCIPKMASLVLSHGVVDEDLLYNVLLACDSDDAVGFLFKNLKLYKRHPKVFAGAARVGLRLLNRYKIETGKSSILETLITLKWYKRFIKKKLDYDVFFTMNPNERFEFLVKMDCLDVGMIREFCKDFHFNLETSYIAYLKLILLNWKLEYEIETDGLNQRSLIVKNSEADLAKKCKEVMEHIDKKIVMELMSAARKSVNTYYYEVFLAIIDIMSEIDPNSDSLLNKNMLLFLKHYRRVSKPSETEIEHWYTNFPDTQALDPLSEFRFPFTSLLFSNQIFSIIRPEINLKTYKLWYKAIPAVRPYLNKDDICSYVVKDVASSRVLGTESNESWVMLPKYEDLLEEIDECVLNISDLERATAAVYHLLTHMPNGADQVKAAALCYKYALQYREQDPNSKDVEKAVIKVEKKYFSFSAMHILHTHGLAEKEYLNLVSHPNELILALYLDDRILKKNDSDDLQCPPINKATEALAALFRLNIKNIRANLVQNWLSNASGLHLELESTMKHANNFSGNDNLYRAAYICSADDVSNWQAFLIQKSLNSGAEEEMDVGWKARALKVFAMISDVETISSLTGTSYSEFVNLVDKYWIIYDLQYLGIGLDVDGLDACNKKELLKSLAQRQGNLLAVKAMATICMTYMIYETRYWEFIMNSSIKYSMFAELKSYVDFLKKPKYQNKSFYINGWQAVIDHFFVLVSNAQDDRLDKTLMNTFLAIQSCPVVYRLNFENAFRRCKEKGREEYAAVLLQYMEGDRRAAFVREILDSNRDLSACLSNLDQSGLWGIPNVQVMLANQR